jgi:UDP-GlcNAc3NAcA epimerase
MRSLDSSARLRVLTVVGARPQFIKAAPVSRVLRAKHDEFLLHTGQHYDVEMSEVFFKELGIPAADRNLEVGSGGHGAQTGAMLAGIESVAEEYRPDWVLVYGDTNSTLAGAIAGAKLQVRVAHVEAGLRSFDRRMPEEINRVVADHVSDLLLCPSQIAVDNLKREGVVRGVAMVGDVMLDLFLRQGRVATREADGYYLLTLHRPENVDDPERLRTLLSAVAAPGKKVVFPVHPRTHEVIDRAGIALPDNVHATDPIGYREMVALETGAELILTDSGGVQKEAYFAGTPCVTLRESTEWPETVAAGWNLLVGSDPDAIASAIKSFRPQGSRPDLYGDGYAAERVVAALERS